MLPNPHLEHDKLTPPPDRPLRFGRLLAVCLLAVAFCGWLVWFALTYLPDCCGP
jgi:hypothetical protein